ncbi:class I SAM-dependent methyltransferase [Nocardia sp. NPDC058658]|uniref:class I SAM-dependent methyltransferase n=1 Tax=Nocardia sp. NPDC058658 TaxID=3346580 RepID=UPI003655C06C
MAESGSSTERTADEAEWWARRASSFGARAAEYAEHRPDYPAAAIRWALELCGDRRLVVLDLAAGTGKLSGGLLAAGAEVIAVEPDEAMRAELVRLFPDITALPGTAEAIPLADGSVDAVVVGQAFHFFDREQAFPEIARVLRDDGVFATLSNIDDGRVPWVAGLQKAMRKGLSLPPSSSPPPTNRLTHPLFTEFERAEFPHSQTRTAESLTTTIGTYSHTTVIPARQRDELLSGIRAYLRAHPETALGEFDFPLRTRVIRAVRLTSETQ